MGNCLELTITIRLHSFYRKIGTKSTLTKADRWPGLLEGNLNLGIIIKLYIACCCGPHLTVDHRRVIWTIEIYLDFGGLGFFGGGSLYRLSHNFRLTPAQILAVLLAQGNFL